MSLLDRVDAFAEEAHRGQMRWDKTPYIEHPRAVAKLAVELYGDLWHSLDMDTDWYRRDCLILGILGKNHDVPEDCDKWINQERALTDHLISLDTDHELSEIDWECIYKGLRILNKHNHINYLAFTLAAKADFYSRIVKRADIRHNRGNLSKGSMLDKYNLALYILETP